MPVKMTNFEETTSDDLQGGERRQRYRHVLSRPSSYRIGYLMGKWLPRGLLFRIADVLADLTYRKNEAPARNLRKNLEDAFPELSGPETSDLAKRIFRNFARNIVDYGRFHVLTDASIRRLFPVVENMHYLEEAVAGGKGAILVTGHIGSWELGALFFGRLGHRVNVVTIPEASRGIDSIRGAYRMRENIRTIVVDGSPFSSIEMVTALRRGEIVAMLVDRYGQGEGVPVRYFGRIRRFPRGPFVLGRATGAPILPAYIVRSGKVYVGRVEPPIAMERETEESGARKVVESLERMARNYPDQWYNFQP